MEKIRKCAATPLPPSLSTHLVKRPVNNIEKNLEKKIDKITKCAAKHAKSQICAGKISKSGTFQTAVPAQPIELSQKRRHFPLGFLGFRFESTNFN
jgi:hypothetical protein